MEQELSSSAHDISHTYRVFKNCLEISKSIPEVDVEILRVSSLLHDIAKVQEEQDNTGSTDHAFLGAEMAKQILLELNYPITFIEHVCDAIRTHRYRGENIPSTLEAKVLFDADKLDAIGAIGIARSFMIAGEYGQLLYKDTDLEEYIKTNLVGGSKAGRIQNLQLHSPNIEFELKLKKIPERLFTDSAKLIAMKRLEYMSNFFKLLREEYVL